MIIESKPLHKKKKRLAKQNSKRGELSRQASVVSIIIINSQEGFCSKYIYFCCALLLIAKQNFKRGELSRQVSVVSILIFNSQEGFCSKYIYCCCALLLIGK